MLPAREERKQGAGIPLMAEREDAEPVGHRRAAGAFHLETAEQNRDRMTLRGRGISGLWVKRGDAVSGCCSIQGCRMANG